MLLGTGFQMFITIDLYNMRILITSDNIYIWWSVLVVTACFNLMVGGNLHSGNWFRCGVTVYYLCLSVGRGSWLMVGGYFHVFVCHVCSLA